MLRKHIAKKQIRIPLSIEENTVLTNEVLRRRRIGLYNTDRKGVPALINEFIEKQVIEMQEEMDNNNAIVLTIDRPVITEENYTACVYMNIDAYENLITLADYVGYSAIRLAKYMTLKELSKLPKGE